MRFGKKQNKPEQVNVTLPRRWLISKKIKNSLIWDGRGCTVKGIHFWSKLAELEKNLNDR
jgi:hypothetical protein